MNKIVTAILATLLVASGLIGATQSTATAARNCPYTGCAPTRTVVQVDNPLKKGKAARATVRANVKNANRRPAGSVRLIVRGISGKADGFRWTSKYKNSKSVQKFVTPKLRKTGKYQFRGEFRAKRGAALRGSQSTVTVRVR